MTLMGREGKRILSLFAALLLSSGLVFSQAKPGADPPSSDKKFGSLQKSLLLPGWGQLSEKRTWEGLLFLGSELVCAYGWFAFNRKGNEFYRLYKDADNAGDATAYRELTERYDKKRNRTMMLAAGIWAVNLLDIALIVRNKERKGQRAAVVAGTNEYGQTQITLSFSF